jgi:adenylate kinase
MLGACHLSTGDIFRAAKSLKPCDCSPAVAEALEAMRRGELVVDNTIIAMVRERTRCLRCGGGFLLDGFPRTVGQAEALDAMLGESGIRLDGVLSYEMNIQEIVNRLSGRRTCAACKAVYHVTGRPPRKSGICDACRGELIQREDDRPESIRVRMQAYEENTRPLATYYAAQGSLIPVPATGTPEDILDRTLHLLVDRQ